jgi:hypothetical protein
MIAIGMGCAELETNCETVCRNFVEPVAGVDAFCARVCGSFTGLPEAHDRQNCLQ